ncbi:MAG: DUF2178 domain-containing protein [Dehalococcoidales bacterium]|nr:DUF2178 domain-containing protein [Dehalococcoidales bacterium]
MKHNRAVIVLSIAGIIAGAILYLLPVIQGNSDSGVPGFLCFFAGTGIFLLSLASLERIISGRKRPGLLRRQRIEQKDERNTLIRDKAGARTLTILMFMIMISVIVYYWFDIGMDYMQLIWWILIANCVFYFGWTWYYKQRL